MLKEIEITRDNYQNLEWNEHVMFKYRGLLVTCDHEYDAGVYIVWLKLPSGPNYIFNSNKNGDLPYNHQYDAGYMEGKNAGPDFAGALESIMDYVDKYYHYLSEYIKN